MVSCMNWRWAIDPWMDPSTHDPDPPNHRATTAAAAASALAPRWRGLGAERAPVTCARRVLLPVRSRVATLLVGDSEVAVSASTGQHTN